MKQTKSEKKELCDYTHNLKKELILLNRDVFEKKQKLIQNNIAFLWDLKFKFMEKQNNFQLAKMEKAFTLKNKK